MSAYGQVLSRTSSKILDATLWPLKSSDSVVVLHHLTLKTAQDHADLIPFLNQVFDQELQDGRTYPQEAGMERQAFEQYFFAADVFLALVADPTQIAVQPSSTAVTEIKTDLDAIRNGRPWEQCVAGFYYVKSNYPGRSSHICNAGFVTVPSRRGQGIGTVLSKSFVHYAPKLGYKGSVFNLVYVNNVASIKLWERLNFTKVGRIPKAGRLRKADGDGEEYVDAWVIYKSFEENDKE